ncbi:MAG TPA: hypothetical protein PKA90_11730 [Ignavibacteria bacterium]|nr:hypothetical protein [Ignavibacteria bacterium]HMR41089.1 hypothetical protein [Ignavibacteria bacterium]
MHNSRITEILKSFSPAEIREFKKFLESPFFGCKPFILKFYKELIRYYPEFDGDRVNRKVIFDKLYKGKTYDDGLFRKMSSDLVLLSEEYILNVEFRNNKAFRDQSLLSGLRNKKLNNHFELRSAKMQRKLEDDKAGSQTFFNRFLIQNEIHNHHLTIKNKELGTHLESGLISHTIIFTEHLLNFMRYMNSFKHEYVNQSEILKNLLKNFDLKNFAESHIQEDDEYFYYLKLIYLKYQISEYKDDEESYRKFKKLLFENKEKLTGHTVINSFAAMSQFIARHNHKSDSKYIQDAFEINEIILKDKLFLEHSEFLQITFCGYHISTCRKLNRIDAVKDFLKTYSVYFHPDYKDEMINYCKAIITFSENKFERSLALISEVNLDRPSLKASVKVLKIKNCYELGYTEMLYSELSALKRFCSSGTMLVDEFKLNIKNFIYTISKIAKLKEMNDTDELIILKKKTGKENNLLEKTWLMRKAGELM